jgi:hypothetical protein
MGDITASVTPGVSSITANVTPGVSSITANVTPGVSSITANVTPGAVPGTGIEISPPFLTRLGTPSVEVPTDTPLVEVPTDTPSVEVPTDTPSVTVPTDAITVDAGGTLTVNGIFEAVSVGITGGSISGTGIVLRNLPTSSLLVGSHATGQLVFCTDGDSGSPCLAVYDGTSFKRIVLGATVSP